MAVSRSDTNTVLGQARNTVESAREALVQQKQDFLAGAEQKLKDLDAKIDELSNKAANSTQEARAQADQALKNLKDQRATLAQKIDELKAAGKEGWEKAKAGFAAGWADVERAYQDAKAKLQE